MREKQKAWCANLFSVAMIKYSGQNKLGEATVYLAYRSQHTNYPVIKGSHNRTSSRNLQAGPEAQTMKGFCLLACLPGSLSYHILCSRLIYLWILLLLVG